MAKPLAFLLCLSPALWFTVRGFQGKLGPNPVEAVTHATGDWTIWFLLLTLAVTPLRRLLKRPALIRFRRMLGLFSFFYGSLHFITWAWLDKFFDAREMWDDVIGRRFIFAGITAFVLMIPLAITSTSGWIHRLGGRNWQLLHRLIYISAIAGVVHYLWLVKSDIREPLVYGAILAVLLGIRVIINRSWSRPAELR